MATINIAKPCLILQSHASYCKAMPHMIDRYCHWIELSLMFKLQSKGSVGTSDTFMMYDTFIFELPRKTKICICEIKGADQLCSSFVFNAWIVQSVFFLDLKFQASNYFLWLHRSICVGPV